MLNTCTIRQDDMSQDMRFLLDQYPVTAEDPIRASKKKLGIGKAHMS